MKKYRIKKDDDVVSVHNTELEAIREMAQIKPSDKSIMDTLKKEGYTIEPFLEKEEDFAFSKRVYLLGQDEEGISYWLEAPSWDCGWYWGFGYIESYQGNFKPSKAKDIDSHSHAKGFYREWWDTDKEKSRLKLTTFSEAEGWKLSELFQRFEILKDTAGLFGRGGAHISGTDDYIKREVWAKEINEMILPKVFEDIINILSPKK